MIFTQYKNEDASDVFYINLANTADVWPGYKSVTATYHLENAIKKAVREGKVKTFQVKVADPHNNYLRVLANILVVFIRGQGFEAVNTEGF